MITDDISNILRAKKWENKVRGVHKVFKLLNTLTSLNIKSSRNVISWHPHSYVTRITRV